MKKIKLIEVDSEIGAGTRGASLGIDAMKVASINQGSDYFAKFQSIKVESENQILFGNTQKSCAKNIKTLTKVSQRISKSLKKVIKEKSFPIVLAGDHSNAAGTIAGIKSAHPKKRLGVIWVDAHADLHSPFTTPSGNIHGMPLAIALGIDNLDRQINKVPKATVKQWEKLKNTSGVSPNIKHSDLVFIGVRDTEEPEEYLMEKHNIKNVTVTEVRMKGINKIIKEINDYLKACDLIYISFDVDSMDCMYVSHGTGTPVPMGFTEGEVTKILLKLLSNDKVCCFEVTEVNPTLDEKCNVMAETAFRILEKATAAIIK
ncbi:MAG: arginase [Saprospiraceae bacterium]|jgi:arginase